MEINPFLKGRKLKSTGLNEARLNKALNDISKLDNRQNELVGLSSDNNLKQNAFEKRQGELQNALISENNKFEGYGVRGGKKRKTRRYKKNKKSRKHRKSKKY